MANSSNINAPEPDQTTPSGKLPASSLVSRLVVIGVIVFGMGFLFAYAGGWLTPRALTPARIADRFEALNGVHPGFRRNHAKGVCVSGYFESNGKGAALCKSSIFQTGRVPVVGRFSLGGGLPYAADSAQNVRGLGILFQLPNGEEWRTAMIDLPVFPVKTPQAFYELLLASAPDPASGKPDPAKMKTFIENNPESAKAFPLIGAKQKSSGFANSSFNSLNSFRFISTSGAVSAVRWSLAPLEAFEAIAATDAQSTNKNQLFDSLIARIHHHALAWRLMITVAQPGDPTDDSSIPWPPERQQIEVGTLTIDHVESDDTSVARDINFDPLVLPNGIAASDDPLLSARSAVYSQSFTRREGEHKEASAISTTETGK